MRTEVPLTVARNWFQLDKGVTWSLGRQSWKARGAEKLRAELQDKLETKLEFSFLSSYFARWYFYRTRIRSLSCWILDLLHVVVALYMDLLKLFHWFVKLVFFGPFPNKTKISKIFEASALNKRCWMSQRTQCPGFWCAFCNVFSIWKWRWCSVSVIEPQLKG